MYRTILAAVDESARAQGVVDAAIEIAERFDGRVHLFRWIAVPPYIPPAAPAPPDPLPEQLALEAREKLTVLAAGHPRVVVEAPDLISANPWRAAIDTATRLEADLIVIGSHGYGGWDHILRTNAANFADRADRNVLVVHTTGGRPR